MKKLKKFFKYFIPPVFYNTNRSLLIPPIININKWKNLFEKKNKKSKNFQFPNKIKYKKLNTVNINSNFNIKLVDYLRNFNHQGGIVASENKFIYMKPGKTAGTSIFHHILRKKISNILHYRINNQNYSKWLNNLNSDNLSNYFIFTVVRNPFDRVVSICAYFNITIDNFIKNYNQKKLNEQLFLHSIPLSKYNFIDNTQFTNYVCKFESLDNDLNFVFNKLDLDVTDIPHVNKTYRSEYQEYFNRQQIDQIYEIYEDDFKNFGYSF
tara:strand:- start:123 stop:923 length:801 start_codon:yes stop_codon:yes gene_type:complete